MTKATKNQLLRLESDQQSHFGSQFAFMHFNLKIEMQIGTQIRGNVIPCLKPILNTSKWKVKIRVCSGHGPDRSRGPQIVTGSKILTVVMTMVKKSFQINHI